MPKIRKRHPAIDRYWYSIDWDVAAIWALELPVGSLGFDALAWHLDMPVWPGPWGPYTVTPNEVLADPVTHAGEHARILRADLAYPLDVYRHRGRWMILDGIHRLARAATLGRMEMQVREVPETAVRRL